MIPLLEPEFVKTDSLILSNWSDVPQDYYYMLGLKNVKSLKK